MEILNHGLGIEKTLEKNNSFSLRLNWAVKGQTSPTPNFFCLSRKDSIVIYVMWLMEYEKELKQKGPQNDGDISF